MAKRPFDLRRWSDRSGILLASTMCLRVPFGAYGACAHGEAFNIGSGQALTVGEAAAQGDSGARSRNLEPEITANTGWVTSGIALPISLTPKVLGWTPADQT